VAARTEDLQVISESGQRVLSTGNLLFNTGWPLFTSVVIYNSPSPIYQKRKPLLPWRSPNSRTWKTLSALLFLVRMAENACVLILFTV